MNFLDNMTVGTAYKKTPYIGAIYGAGGTGKTGLAVYAPDPLFIPLEPGTRWIFGNKELQGLAQCLKDKDGNMFIPTKAAFEDEHDQLFQTVRWLCNKKNHAAFEKQVKTIVIDGMRFAENMFYADIVRCNPMTEGKSAKKVMDITDLGYDGMMKVIPYWERVFAAAERLRSIGFNVIFIAHSARRNDDAPDGTRFKYIDMDLQSYGEAKVPNMFQARCDWVYYIDSAVQTKTSGAGKWTRTVASGTSEAEFNIHTRKTSLFYAKSRSVDGSLIPDAYSFTIESRAETAKQLFADLENT